MAPPESEFRVAASVRHCCALLRELLERPGTSAGLLVGCDRGDEAAFVHHTLGSPRIVGADLKSDFSARARVEADLVVADAQTLPFPAGTFDFVAAIHSLEHMGDPHRALAEVSRVLRPAGWFYVGVPNKKRLLGYIGSYDANLWQKVYWNVVDYGYRLRGQFENRLGAHAGFEGQELMELLSAHFAYNRLLTEGYLRFKYAARMPKGLLDGLLSPPLHQLHCSCPLRALSKKVKGCRFNMQLSFLALQQDAGGWLPPRIRPLQTIL
jgi:SAM-dependent methyltransferase